MRRGDLVRVTIIRSSGDDAPVIGIITKSLGGIVTDDPMWFNVMIEGKIEAVNEGEIEVLSDSAGQADAVRGGPPGCRAR
jgi:hypothetical protein